MGDVCGTRCCVVGVLIVGTLVFQWVTWTNGPWAGFCQGIVFQPWIMGQSQMSYSHLLSGYFFFYLSNLLDDMTSLAILLNIEEWTSSRYI